MASDKTTRLAVDVMLEFEVLGDHSSCKDKSGRDDVSQWLKNVPVPGLEESQLPEEGENMTPTDTSGRLTRVNVQQPLECTQGEVGQLKCCDHISLRSSTVEKHGVVTLHDSNESLEAVQISETDDHRKEKLVDPILSKMKSAFIAGDKSALEMLTGQLLQLVEKPSRNASITHISSGVEVMHNNQIREMTDQFLQPKEIECFSDVSAVSITARSCDAVLFWGYDLEGKLSCEIRSIYDSGAEICICKEEIARMCGWVKSPEEEDFDTVHWGSLKVKPIGIHIFGLVGMKRGFKVRLSAYVLSKEDHRAGGDLIIGMKVIERKDLFGCKAAGAEIAC